MQGSRYVVSGSVQVRDENRALVPNATVYITWTLPDGSTQDQNAVTSSKGLAGFRLRNGSGTYTLTVTDIA
jgi:hypothetical protein